MTRFVKGGDVSTIPAINTKLEEIETAINDTLSRKGDVPNQMEGLLDMNSNRIIGLPAPPTNLDAARLKDVQDIINNQTFSSLSGIPFLLTIAEAQAKNFTEGNSFVVAERSQAQYRVYNSSTTAILGDITLANGNIAVLLPMSNDTYNVVQAGADGITGESVDNTAIFQATFNRNGKMYIPAGTYWIRTLTVSGGSRITGDGHELSVIEKFPDTAGHVIYSPEEAGALDIYMYGFRIDGNRFSYSGGGIQDGIHIEGGTESSRGVIAYDVWVSTTTGDGWYIGPNRNASNIQYCYGLACGSLIADSTASSKGNGIQLDSHSDAFVGSASGFGSCKNRSILVKSSATPVISECEIFWADNRANIEFFQCADFMVRGCNIDGARVAALRVNGKVGTGFETPDNFQEAGFVIGNTFKNFKGTGGTGSDGDVNVIDVYDSIGIIIANNQFTNRPSRGDIKAANLVRTSTNSKNITFIGNSTPIEGDSFQCYQAITNDANKLWFDRTGIRKKHIGNLEIVNSSPSYNFQGNGNQTANQRKSRIRVEDTNTGDIVWESLADNEVDKEVFLRWKRNGSSIFEAIFGSMINIDTFANVAALPAVGDRTIWSFALVQDNGSGAPAFALNDGTNWRLNSFT